MKKSKKRALSITGRTALSLLIIFFILRKGNFDFTKIIEQVASVNPFWVTVAILGFPCLIFVKSGRWHLIAKGAGLSYKLSSCFKSYLAGIAMGVITPGRVGELAKACYLKAEFGAGLGVSLRTVVSDRVYDLLFLFCFGITSLINIFFKFSSVLWILEFILMYMCLAIVIMIVRKIGTRMNFSSSKIDRLKSFIEEVASDLSGTASFSNWLLTIIAYTVYFFTCYALIRGLKIDIGFLHVCFVMSFLSIVLLLPISIAGFGPREATLIYLFSRLGVPAEAALSFAVMQFIVFFLYGGLLGAIVLLAAPLPIWASNKGSSGEKVLMKNELSGIRK